MPPLAGGVTVPGLGGGRPPEMHLRWLSLCVAWQSS